MGAHEAVDSRVPQATEFTSDLRRTTPIGGISKRLFDVTLASMILVGVAPIMLIVAAIIWTTDRGSIIFGHSRIGHGGRPFKCLKFRTMVPNAAEVLQQVLATDPEAAREWAETQKLRNDPRITPIGAVLRKLSIDELPQLINVLRGEMSLVGPRPIVRAEVARYGKHFRNYEAARPGITGLWQVSGRSDSSYAQRVTFDAHYAENWSLRQDFLILWKTAFVVMQRKGSY